MILRYVFLCLFLASTSSLSAQNFNWAHNFEGDIEFYEAISDDYQNIYLTGRIHDTVDFDISPKPADTFYLSSSGSSDIFVAKYDSAGALLWAQVYGAGATREDEAKSMCFDKDGNLYITGFFDQTVDFDKGPAVYNLTATLRDVFILKLDPHGKFIWAKSVGGSQIDVGKSITVDQSNNVLITGEFTMTADFDPGPGTFNMSVRGPFPNSTTTSAFILKLDSSGNFVWAKGLISRSAYANAIVTDDSNNVMVAGYFGSRTNLDPDSVNKTFWPNGNDFYVVKLDSNGSYKWGNHYSGSSDFDHAHSMAVDTFNNIYFSGYFGKTIDFDPDTGIFNMTASKLTDVFVSKLDPQGKLIWAKKLIADDGFLKMNAHNEFYLYGSYRDDTLDVDLSTDTYNLPLNSNTKGEGYIAKYDNDANLIWAINARAHNLNAHSRFFRLAENSYGDIYAFGYYTDTIDVDPGLDTFQLISNNPYAPFILKLNELEADTDKVITCDPYYWPRNQQNYNGNAIYKDTLNQRNGMTFNVLILSTGIDTLIDQKDSILTSSDSLGKYQWMRCDSGYVIINGDTNRSISISQSGSYAVEIIKNGCIDTSECVNVLMTAILEQSTSIKVSLYPNPVNQQLTLEISKGMEVQKITLYNLEGQSIIQYKGPIISTKHSLDVSGLSKGLYLLNIEHSKGIENRKLIVY